VPFRGGGDAVNAIMSGSTPIGLFGEGNVVGHIRAGTMTPLVMMNNVRSPNFPKVPLLTETGYQGAPSRGWYGLFAPSGTPRPIIDRINKEVRTIVSQPAFTAKHLTARSLVPALNSPEEFAADIKRDRAQAKLVVQAAGLTPQ
jgi:tripartite-type tricarboxylate transporter receptor subunit TctC